MNSSQAQSEYLLLFRGNDWKTLSPQEKQNLFEQRTTWFERLKAQGRVIGGNPLADEGRIIFQKENHPVTDGPFVETKEAIGGYLMLRAESLEEVVALARELPRLDTGTTVEIRPIATECPLAEQIKHESELAHSV